jgi:DNA polymerase III epsilon subunit-like protein
MNDFIAIDFETGNPKRVSACALGYAKVSNGEIVEAKGYLIRPVGGHASFQSKIHGIKEEHTFDKPDFGEIFPEISDIFSYPLVGHSLFDQQVLKALFDHFNLQVDFNYRDSSALAKERLPHLKNHKLKTLSKHFNLPCFKHHDATDDALTCARIFLKLHSETVEENITLPQNELDEFRGFAKGILADEEVNYKEAYELLYWLEDHISFSQKFQDLYSKTKDILEDDVLDSIEAIEIKNILQETMNNLFMKKLICRSINEPIRDISDFDERWRGPDNGLITCWEVGRRKSLESPELADRAKNGELPVLGWKGGVEKEIQKKEKYGSLNYLAQWQGLRGEDLNIDPAVEVEIVCSKTGMKVIYTADTTKFAEP